MVLQKDVETQTEEKCDDLLSSLNLKRKSGEPENVKTKIIIVKSDKDGVNNLNNTLQVDIKCNKCSQDFNRIAAFIAHMKENCVNSPESIPKEQEKNESSSSSLQPPPNKKRILIIRKQQQPKTSPPLQEKQKHVKKPGLLKTQSTVSANTNNDDDSDDDEVQIVDQKINSRPMRNKEKIISLSCPHCNEDGFKSQKELEGHFEKNWKIVSCFQPGCNFECTYICEMQVHSSLHRRTKIAKTYKLKKQLKSKVQENINGLNIGDNFHPSSTATSSTTFTSTSSSITLPTPISIPISIPFAAPVTLPFQMPLQFPAPALGQNTLSFAQPTVTSTDPGGETYTVDEIAQKVAMEYFNLLFCSPDSNPFDGQTNQSLMPVPGQSIYYSCKECSKCFVKDTELGLHLTKCDNPCPFPGCECLFDLPCSLELHLQLHEPIPVHSCPQQEFGLCDKSFITLPALLHHRVSQHGENLDLTHIDELLSTNTLNDAEKIRRRELTKAKTYSCPLCPEEQTPFRHLIVLENHKKKEHSENNNNDQNNSNSSGSSSKNTENVVTIDDDDDADAEPNQNPNNNEKGKAKNKTKDKEKEKKCKEKVFMCPVENCGQKFSMIRYIKVHAKTHRNIESTTIDQILLCPVCGKSFKSKCLNTHMQTHAEDRVLFECKEEGCGKSFTNQRSLETHSYDHTGVFPYLCQFCSAGYKSKSRLRVHELSHSEKKFKCDFPDCEYKTVSKFMLKKHKQKHENRKDYVCDECGIGFNYSSTLYRHKFVHTKNKKPKQRGRNQMQVPVPGSTYPNAQEFQQDEYYDDGEEEEDEDSEMEDDD